MNLIYPVGIVVTLGVSTNPNTLFGVGTWSAIAGKVIVGINAGDAEFDTLDETGGAKTHTLSTDEMPAHTHNYTLRTQTNNGQIEPTGGDGDAVATPTSSAGGGQAHNNLQPYIVKYVWQRAS
jgi:microcystin-dependent protein